MNRRLQAYGRSTDSLISPAGHSVARRRVQATCIYWQDVAPLVEVKVPTAHTVHTPVPSRYWPAGQPAQLPPEIDVCPVGHRVHEAILVLPAPLV
jgi:hypothetical protein